MTIKKNNLAVISFFTNKIIESISITPKRTNKKYDTYFFIILFFYMSPQPGPQASIKAAVASPFTEIK